jgi:hypothetical protein
MEDYLNSSMSKCIPVVSITAMVPKGQDNHQCFHMEAR